MADLVDISSRIIDSGVVDQMVNRVTNELSELAEDLAIVESFSHCVAFDSGDGLVCFDSSGVHTGQAVVTALKGWRPGRISHLVYTHGHADHVGGSTYFAADQPTVVGHRNVATRLDRYDYTNNWNLIINSRQFGGIPGELNLSIGEAEGGARVDVADARRFLPRTTLRPSETFDLDHSMHVGDTQIELHHARGETDDHLWAWLPDRKWIMAGDFVIWNFPNAGNPQKVQRYPVEWAAALRANDRRRARVAGTRPRAADRRSTADRDGARRHRHSTGEPGCRRDRDDESRGNTRRDHSHGVGSRRDARQAVPPSAVRRTGVRDSQHLAPVRWMVGRRGVEVEAVAGCSGRATAIAELCGGADALIRRAQQAIAENDLRLACHLADLAGWAAPGDVSIHAARAEVYIERRKAEPSLMSKGIFMAAAREVAVHRRGVSFLTTPVPAQSPRTQGRPPATC